MVPEPVLRRIGPRYDPARLAVLAVPGADLAELLAAMANSSGGHVLLGCGFDATKHVLLDAAGISLLDAAQVIKGVLARVDPGIAHLVTVEPVQALVDRVSLVLISVRQSAEPPHLVLPEGRVLLSLASGVRSVRSRAELDALYQRGYAERSWAERQVETMIAKQTQAHYAFYGLGFAASTRHPTAELYLHGQEHPETLIRDLGAFAAKWDLQIQMIKVRPGELEVRGERDVRGYARVTRSGCIAIGEVQRRPPGNVLGRVDDVIDRVSTVIDAAGRILERWPELAVVPCLFFEGLRGQRLTVGERPYLESGAVGVDTMQFWGNTGELASAAYRLHLTAELLTKLLASFDVQFEPASGPSELDLPPGT